VDNPKTEIEEALGERNVEAVGRAANCGIIEPGTAPNYSVGHISRIFG
jgi:hypothetical protein